MAEVEIAYKGSLIASMDATESKTLQTSGKYCEDDIAVYYARPSGGSNMPVAAATITSITEFGNEKSFDVILPRAITKGIVLFEPDASTLAEIYADTSTSYYICSLFAMFPTTIATAGSATMTTRMACVDYRGSTGTFNMRSAQTSVAFNLTITGTTLTVSWGSSAIGNFFPSGTYKVTVWEVADS